MSDNIINEINITGYIKNRFGTASVTGKRINTISNFEKEYNSIKETVALRVLTENTIIKLTGKDTLEFLHRVSTNDLKELKEFEVKNTLFTNEKGRLIDRTSLLNLNEFYLLLGGKNSKSLLLRWIDKYIIMEDIKLSDAGNEYVVVEIMGPQSESYLTQICGKCIDELPEKTVKNFEMDELSAMLFKLNDQDNYQKYFMLLKAENAEKTLDYLLNQNNIFDINLIGENVYNHYRIEKGLAETPNEINDNFNPYEANLIDEVNFKKGCYIGQEVIARLDTYDKVQKVMCKVEFDEKIDNTEDEIELFDDKNSVGYLTSFSPNSHFSIGLAIIRKAYAETGKKLSAKTIDKTFDVTVKEKMVK